MSAVGKSTFDALLFCTNFINISTLKATPLEKRGITRLGTESAKCVRKKEGVKLKGGVGLGTLSSE